MMAEKTDAQKRAQKKYIESIARVEIVMPKEKKDEVQQHAETRGETIGGFIKRAIDETMEREK